MIELKNVKKPNKNDAYSLVMDLKLMITNGRGIALDENSIDELLMFFAPATPAKPKDAMQWLAKATDPKHRYKSLGFINVAGGVAMACDGFRFHWCDSNLTDGMYDPKTMIRLSDDLARDMGHIPDFSRFINEHNKARFGTEWSVSELTSVDPKQMFKGVRINDAVNVDRKYWNESISPGCDKLSLTDASSNIHGSNQFGNFMIAPFREPNK